MNRLSRIWRTTTFRLTAIFIVISVIFAVFILGYIAWQSSLLIQNQQERAIERELADLTRHYRRSGTLGVVQAIQRLSRGPSPGIYYVADPSGIGIAGNVADVPPEILRAPGRYTFSYERDRPFGDADDFAERPEARGHALVRSFTLPSGFRVVVGRDIVERRRFAEIIFQAFSWGVVLIVVLSVIAGLISARRVLRRIDAISGTSQAIMSGNLSERVPVTTHDDEFDRLARNLNAMLERIEQLMIGLKDVTDNVAHDLKTPLTRLRNQAEAALREGGEGDAATRALEATIEECDQLIRTFNALLLIARVEAGTPSGAFETVDLSAVANDIADLYAPVAEDAGLRIEVEAGQAVTVRANRELIGQVLVNLIENALKYARASENAEPVVIIRVLEQTDHVLLEVADHGPGIPEQDRERVLERFVRLQQSRTEPGSGLGLSLVAAVARLHRAELEIADNRPGTSIRLRLPR